MNILGISQSQQHQLKMLPDWEYEQLTHNEVLSMNQFLHAHGISKTVNMSKRLEIFYDNLLPMKDHYVGEKTIYNNHVERIMNHQIFTYDGKLFNISGEPITTDPLNFDTGAILIMDFRGNLFLANKVRGEIHHSTILAGKDSVN